ncbi:unnamed protein product, partial [Musa acuminata subsp. burmannicoides]
DEDGILLLDVNIILGAGDYCAWAALPVSTQGEPTEGVGRSFVTDNGNRKPSRKRRECCKRLATPAFLLFHRQSRHSGAATGKLKRYKRIIYYEFFLVGVVGAVFHFSLRSTTTTLMLSALCLAKASFVSSTAASEHDASPPATSSSSSPPPCRHILAMSQAVSLLTTSHSPSLARIRHSSPSSLSNTVTSGSDITYGFK